MAPHPNRTIVPWVHAVGVYDDEKRRIAVLFSHVVHPVIAHWSSEAITADYPGYARNYLRNQLDKGGEP